MQFLSGQKYENKNKVSNINFGSITPTQMFAAETSPRTFKEKRNTVTTKPNQLDQAQALVDEITFFEAEANTMASIVGAVGGASDAAFKFSAKGVVARNENAGNKMLQLGGGIEPKPEGKYKDVDHVCLKPTHTENMYPIDDTNTMVRRNNDEFPVYTKDSETGAVTYRTQIETKEDSKLQKIMKTDYSKKTSHVHLTSNMKAKGNP